MINVYFIRENLSGQSVQKLFKDLFEIRYNPNIFKANFVMSLMSYKPIYEHLAAHLTERAGTPVRLCDSRSPPRADRFTLTGVPLDISLNYILQAIAHHHGLPIEPIFSQRSDDAYCAGVIRSGRGGMMSTVSMSRVNERVLVDISSS